MASNKPVRWPTEIIKQSAPWLSVFNKRSAKTPAIAESKDVSSAIQLPPVPITAGSPRHYSGWNPTVTPAHARLAGCRRNGGSHRDFFTLPARRKSVRKLHPTLTLLFERANHASLIPKSESFLPAPTVSSAHRAGACTSVGRRSITTSRRRRCRKKMAPAAPRPWAGLSQAHEEKPGSPEPQDYFQPSAQCRL